MTYRCSRVVDQETVDMEIMDIACKVNSCFYLFILRKKLFSYSSYIILKNKVCITLKFLNPKESVDETLLITPTNI